MNVYTHGEMLSRPTPTPRLAAYPQLKGNFLAPAWQNQQLNFQADLLPHPLHHHWQPQHAARVPLHADRVHNRTGGISGMAHIGEEKDFSPVIETALRLADTGTPPFDWNKRGPAPPPALDANARS